MQEVTGSVNPSRFTLAVEKASFAILTLQETRATNWYWDTSMSVGLQGGSGTWGANRLNGNWSTSVAGENPMLAWADGCGAVFDAGLSSGGTITVTETVSPRSLVVNRAGCDFTGSGTILLLLSNGVSGTPYYLLTSTNAALPMTNWTPALTDVFGPGGSFSNTLPPSPAEPVRFYRVRQAQ